MRGLVPAPPSLFSSRTPAVRHAGQRVAEPPRAERAFGRLWLACRACAVVGGARRAHHARRARARTAAAAAAGAGAVSSQALRAALLGQVRDMETGWQPPAEGRLPAWLRGALLRNGPALYATGGGGRLRHLFDGYGFLARWELDGPGDRARYAGRFVGSRASEAVRFGLDGRPPQMEFSEFGTPPGRDRPTGLLGQWAGVLRSALSGLTDNANVTIAPLPSGDGETLWLALSEPVCAQFLVDPISLRTLRAVGPPSFPPPLFGLLMQTAHPQWSESLGGLVNVGAQLLPPRYVVTLTRASQAGIQTRTLAEIPCAGLMPSWMHSFALEEDFLVLVEMPCHCNIGTIMGLSGLILPGASHVSLDWDDRGHTRVHVISLLQPEVSAVHDFPAFFFFHTAQAALRPATGGSSATLEVDLCVYDDPGILPATSLERILSRSEPLPNNGRLVRMELPLPGAPGRARLWELCDPAELGGFCEFPQVSPRASRGVAGRFIFATCAAGRSAIMNCIARVDTQTGAVVRWAGAAGEGEEVVSEPAFVPLPEADGAAGCGALLVPTHDDAGASLVVLDAERMVQVARWRIPPPPEADGPAPVPYSVHGAWVQA